LRQSENVQRSSAHVLKRIRYVCVPLFYVLVHPVLHSLFFPARTLTFIGVPPILGEEPHAPRNSLSLLGARSDRHRVIFLLQPGYRMHLIKRPCWKTELQNNSQRKHTPHVSRGLTLSHATHPPTHPLLRGARSESQQMTCQRCCDDTRTKHAHCLVELLTRVPGKGRKRHK
jgi:hypothetical protein